MSVYQDKTGQWWACVDVGYTRTGGRKRVRRRASGKRAALRIEGQLFRDRDAGKLEGAITPTVKKWAATWLADQATRIRPNTWSGYKTMTRYAVETIGGRRLSQLTPADIRAFTQTIRRAGVTSTAVRDNQTRLYAMLKAARAEGYTVPDTALAVPLASRAVTDRDAIPIDDALAILAALTEQADGSRWVAALLQAMRQGECLGLTWKCVDLDAGVMDISWQLQALRFKHGCLDEQDAPTCGRKFAGHCPRREFQVPDDYEYRVLHGALALVRPKTARGQRLIPMVPWLRAALLAWREQAPASPHDLVWPQPDGKPRISRDDSTEWHALQDRAEVAHVDGKLGRRYTLHEARHTTATLLLEADVDPHTITAIMGHSSIITTRGYQHVDQTLARSALEKVAARLQLVAADSVT